MNLSTVLIMVSIFFFVLPRFIAANPSLDNILAAGKCEAFDDVPEACQFILNQSLIWTVPAYGLSQEYWTASMYTPPDNSTQGVLDPLPAMPYECATAYLSLMCPTFFRPCLPPGPGIPHPLPASMCQSECIYVNDVCASVFMDTPLNCNQTDPLTDLPLWPTSGCLTISDLPEPIEAPTYPCPDPLIFVAPKFDPYTGLPCSSTCHLKLRQLTEDPATNYDAMFITFSVLNWVSFVAVTITLIVYPLFPVNRKFPRVINTLIGVGLWIVHFGFIGNSFRSADGNFCQSDIQLQSSSSWCRFQAWTAFFGAL